MDGELSDSRDLEKEDDEPRESMLPAEDTRMLSKLELGFALRIEASN